MARNLIEPPNEDALLTLLAPARESLNSQFGHVEYCTWCELEAERINRGIGGVVVVWHGDKCAIARKELL